MTETTKDDGFVRAAEAEEVRASGRARVAVEGRNLAVFYHEGEFHAVDNRCPHMGFPLIEGTVDDGILTCHWHHARFELGCGDTFDLWADDLATYPTEVRDGDIYVDPRPHRDRDPVEHWTERLKTGLRENLSLIVAKSTVHLLGRQVDPVDPIREGVEFGASYRAGGWGRGLTTLGVMARLVDHAEDEDVGRAVYTGLTAVADSASGEPPFFAQESLDNRDVSAERLDAWFRENIEVGDANGAERVMRTAVRAEVGESELARMLYGAATDHLYRNTGHSLDFINKAFETLDRVGWDRAESVLASLVPGLAEASRAEESSAWRQPIDVADMIFEARAELAERIEEGADRSWREPDDWIEMLLGDDPRAIVGRLSEAVSSGASARQLASTVAYAAGRRIAQFGTTNEFRDWNTVHHTFSYANAVHGVALRTDGVEAYRGIFDAAIKVYLDRFLNTPPARIPAEYDGTGDPEALLEPLVETFDVEEEGAVDRAGRLTARYIDARGDIERLRRTFTGRLLREDAGFHPNQNLEAVYNQLAHQDDRERERTLLVAAARYLAAHTPTRRSGEQTYEIATRLYRGEKIHEAGA